MNGSDFLYGMSEVDNDLIQEAGEAFSAKRRRPAWVKWAAMAACACVLALGAFLVRGGSASVPPPVTGSASADPGDDTTEPSYYALSAASVAALFNREADGVRTNQYQKVYADALEELLSPLPEATGTLELFTAAPAEPDEAAAKAFYQKNLSAMQALSGISSSDASWLERTDAYGNPVLQSILEEIGEMSERGYEEFRMVLFSTAWNGYSISAENNLRLRLDGEIVAFDGASSDQQIGEALKDTIGRLNAMFGTGYACLNIVRTYGYDGLRSIDVFVSDGTVAQVPESLSRAPLTSGYLCLSFYADWGEGSAYDWGETGDEVYLARVTYFETIVPWEQYYSVPGSCRMLSLEEAEEMLAKGYVFGGHSCPLCMAEQEALDFTGYDGVSLEYLAGSEGIYIPFYTFFKDLGVNEYGVPTFAKTYVCAVEVSDLEQYFAAQEAYHSAPAE